jgi:hypothetical protein
MPQTGDYMIRITGYQRHEICRTATGNEAHGGPKLLQSTGNGIRARQEAQQQASRCRRLNHRWRYEVTKVGPVREHTVEYFYERLDASFASGLLR